MTRSIAILTLALSLTIVHSVQAFPHYTDWHTVGKKSVIPSQDRFNPREYTFYNPLNKQGEVYLSNVADELDALIAIIAFESGPEAAYEMLRDMGFNAYEADDRLLNSLAGTSPSKYWDWSKEPTPSDILRDMGFSPYEADAVLNFVNVKDAYSTIFSFSD